MLMLLILLGFAYIQDNFGKNFPTHFWAIVFAVVLLGYLMVVGDEFVSATFTALMLGIYAWVYFGALRHFGSGVAIWSLICLVGAIMPMVVVLVLF